jgi:peptidyl-prolyl cis-trans isomerase D
MAVVVGFLVISFAIWGIGDIFRGFGRSTLAVVGRSEVSIEQFRQIYNDRLQQIGRQIGRPVSLEQARALGIDRQILGQMVADMALDERVRRMPLGLSDAEISRRITSEPGFQGLNGQFDRARFEGLIRQAGYTEARFIAEQRREVLRRQLTGTILAGPGVPQTVLDATSRFQNEQRSIDYVLLDRRQAGEVAPPADDALAKYFEERKILFRSPEYRKIVVLSLLPSQQGQWIEISDADVKQAYEQRRDRYVKAERRHIQQLVFANADQAQPIADRLAKGESFATIAADPAVADKFSDLGSLTKAALIDRSVADVAFALKEGEVTAPVRGRFGVVLAYVAKIEPEQARSFEEVAPEIKRDLATERASSQIHAAYDKIEDERTLGRPLAEIAESLKLPVRTIEVDRSGRTPEGAVVGDLPEGQRVLSSSFTAAVGVENEPLQSEGGYIWYEVAGMTPARDRPLEEVKDRVLARWIEEETANRLQKLAAEFLEKVKGGTDFAEAAAAQKLTVQSKTGLKRSDTASPLSARTLDAVFRTAKGAPASADAEQAAEQIVFRVTDVTVPAMEATSDDAKKLTDALKNAASEEIFAAYISRLESDVGVSVNQTAFNQVVTGRAPTDQTTDQ